MFLAIIENESGEWCFEGEVQNHPIWVLREHAQPKLLTEEEALRIANRDCVSGEIGRAEKA